MNHLFPIWKQMHPDAEMLVNRHRLPPEVVVDRQAIRKIQAAVAVVCIAACTHAARAQNSVNAIVPTSIDSWTPEFYLVMVFCLLGFAVLAMQFVLFMRSKDRVSATDVMRAFSTILILISVVALVGIGYSEQQVQPAYGLIGTLLGYVLGRGSVGGEQQVHGQESRQRDTWEAVERERDHRSDQ